MAVTNAADGEHDDALVAASCVQDPHRGRHPAVLRLRQRRSELAVLLAGFPGREHAQVTAGLYIDGDGALQARHRRLRTVD